MLWKKKTLRIKLLNKKPFQILEQSSLLQETGAAITITPNAFRVLQSWDFSPSQSRMVAIRTGSLLDGTSMEVLMPNYLHNIEETYGAPLYSVHRVDLHNQLRLLATRTQGPGHPVEIQVRAKIVDYVRQKRPKPDGCS